MDKPKLVPMNVAKQAAPGAVATTSATEDTTPPVEAWLDAHPDGFNESTPVESKTPADLDISDTATPTPEAPAAEPTPSPDTPGTADVPETPAPAPQPELAPAAEAPATPEAKPAAEPEKRTYAPDEKFALADGQEWTREQIVTALKERVQLEPRAKEADEFRQVFGMDAPTAKTQWAPLLKRLTTEPQTVAILDAVLKADPAKVKYLMDSAAYYDSEVGAAQAGAAQPAAPSIDPTVQRELNEMRAFMQRQQQEAATARLNREWSEATTQYPFLLQDNNARDALLALARSLNAEDVANGIPEMQARGLKEAVEMQRGLYEARRIASAAAAAPAQKPVVQPAAPAAQAASVPAVLGSPGASPGGSRPTPSTKPKKFDDLGDAVDDWLQNESKSFE